MWRHYTAGRPLPSQRIAVNASHWARDIPLIEKFARTAGEIQSAFKFDLWFTQDRNPSAAPLSYFWVNYPELPKIWLWCFPFFIGGLVAVVFDRRMRLAAPILVLAIAGSIPAGILGLTTTRVSAMVPPILAIICVGLCYVVDWAIFRLARPKFEIAAYLFLSVSLAALGVGLTRYSISKAPKTYPNFGLNGVQFGAKEVFRLINAESSRNPTRKFQISSMWTWAPQDHIAFFSQNPERMKVGHLNDYVLARNPDIVDYYFAITPQELAIHGQHKKFEIKIVDTVLDPRGDPAIHLTSVKYAE
jgi:hypothetical protein